MLTKRELDFQAHFKELKPLVTLENTEKYLANPSVQSDNFFSQNENPQLLIKSQKIQHLAFQKTLMTNGETQDCLIFAFCLLQPNQTSTIALQLCRKKNQAICTKTLKQLNVKVTTMIFKPNKYNKLQLILGTKCGRIFIYRNLQNLDLNVSNLQISASSIHSILPTSLENTIFVLQDTGIIFVIDILDELVKHQLHSILPRIFDSQMKLLADYSYKYVYCCFSYGRVIRWDIKEHTAAEIKLFGQQNQTEAEQEPKAVYSKKLIKKQGKQIGKRNVLLKPMSVFLPCILKGIQWIDLLGNFFIFLTKDGILKVVAADFSEKTSSLEIYKVVTEFKVFQPLQANEKQNLREKIVDLQKLNEKFIMISKQKQKNCSKKGFDLVIQRYAIEENFRISKVSAIKMSLNYLVKQVRMSENQQFIICQTTKGIAISKTPDCQ